jgi:D-3-phosphoglycerate dehydrogenase
VCNTPGANAQAVADLTLGLLLAAARKIPFLDKETREGRWPRSTGIELYGKTLGILGLGAVGRAVAKRGAGFSMRILAYDPFMDEAYAGANGISPAPFERVIAEADFLCLHLPLTPETRHIISAAVMETMRPRAVIVNTARGGLIDEAAAVPFLRSGRLGGMALDVYETEPPEASPLFGLDTVVLTPHTASHTVEATAAMADMAVDNLINVLSSGHCPHMVTFTG